MAIQRYRVGPRMSAAVKCNGMVFVAGPVAPTAEGAGVGEQTKQILALIDEILKEAGTDKSKLLSTNIWLTDIKTFAEMNAVWDAWVAPGNTPARATVGAALAAPQYKVEIAVVAAA